MLEQKTSQRLEYLDIFRGVGIILMVMGHVGFGSVFSKFIHAFHMPMWFFISGYLFSLKPHNESFGLFIKKKAKTLLIPYLVFGLSIFILWSLVNLGEWDLSHLISFLFINTDNLAICGALWFLTALFFANVIYFVIARYIGNSYLKTATIILLALFGNFAVYILPFRLPYALDAAFVGVGLFHIGYLFGSNESKPVIGKLLNMKLPLCFALAIAVTVLIFVNGNVNMREGAYSIIPLFWINAVGATLVGINIAKYISNLNLRIISAANNWLKSIGRYSIVYVCLNQLVIMAAVIICDLLPFHWILIKLIELVITLLALYICSELIMRTRLKVLVGKF